MFRKCPICSEENSKIIINVKMMLPKEMPLPGNYNVVSCNKCGFAFADTKATQADYNRYYKECNMYSDTTGIKNDYAEKICEQRYKLISKYINKSEKILDIGCGDGSLLVYLRTKGYKNLYGMDPSAASVRRLAEQGIEGLEGNLFDEVSKALAENFDVVISTMVIEHLYSLDFFVPNMMKYLRKRGKLFIEAPAADKFDKYITKTAHCFNHEHINYFGIVSLDNLFAKNRFNRINSMEESYSIINSSPPEPILEAVYEYDSEMESSFKRDTATYESLCNYFKIIEAMKSEDKARITKFVEDADKIIIWGTGSYTMQLLAEMPILREKTVFFIDSNGTKQGMVLAGRKVYLPQYLDQYHEEYSILICSMQNAKDIERQISQLSRKHDYIKG